MLLPFRIVTTEQAAQFRAVTQGMQNTLDPRRIEGGQYAGRWAFSDNVMFDPAHANLHALIRVAAPNAIALDTDVAWPEEEG